MPGPLDLRHLGHERVIGSYLLETDDGPALQDCGPTTCVAELKAGLAERGVWMTQFGPRRLRAVTHMDVDDAAIERAGDAFEAVAGPVTA